MIAGGGGRDGGGGAIGGGQDCITSHDGVRFERKSRPSGLEKVVVGCISNWHGLT